MRAPGGESFRDGGGGGGGGDPSVSPPPPVSNTGFYS